MAPQQTFKPSAGSQTSWHGGAVLLARILHGGGGWGGAGLGLRLGPRSLTQRCRKATCGTHSATSRATGASSPRFLVRFCGLCAEAQPLGGGTLCLLRGWAATPHAPGFVCSVMDSRETRGTCQGSPPERVHVESCPGAWTACGTKHSPAPGRGAWGAGVPRFRVDRLPCGSAARAALPRPARLREVLCRCARRQGKCSGLF